MVNFEGSEIVATWLLHSQSLEKIINSIEQNLIQINPLEPPVPDHGFLRLKELIEFVEKLKKELSPFLEIYQKLMEQLPNSNLINFQQQVHSFQEKLTLWSVNLGFINYAEQYQIYKELHTIAINFKDCIYSCHLLIQYSAQDTLSIENKNSVITTIEKFKQQQSNFQNSLQACEELWHKILARYYEMVRASAQNIPKLNIINLLHKDLRTEFFEKFLDPNTRKVMRQVSKDWKYHWEAWMHDNDDFRWKKRLQDEFPHQLAEFAEYKKNLTELSIEIKNYTNQEIYESFFVNDYNGLDPIHIKRIRLTKMRNLELLEGEQLDYNSICVLTDNSGYTLTDWASLKGYTEILLHFFNITGTRYGKTAFDAAIFGQLEKVKSFENLPFLRNAHLQNLLHLAANYGHINLVAYLLENKINVKAQDKNKKQPLHYAAGKGYCDIAKLLLDNNAHVDGLDHDNHDGYCTPLYCAAENNHLEMVRLLLSHQANVNKKNNDSPSRTALHIATEKGFYNVVKVLLDHKANPRARETDGREPLHYAAKNGYLEIAMLLCKSEADVNVYDSQYTPLHYAALYGHFELVKFLITKDTEVNCQARNRDGKLVLTPLHLAAVKGRFAIVNYLLEHGANIEANSEYGTPVFLACLMGYTKVAKLLMAKGATIKKWWPIFFPSEINLSNYVRPTQISSFPKVMLLLIDFEDEFRNILSLLQRSSDSLLSKFFSPSPKTLEKNLKYKLQTLQASDPEYFAHRCLMLFQNPRDWLGLDDAKFQKFCRILSTLVPENSELSKLIKDSLKKEEEGETEEKAAIPPPGH